MLLEQPIRHDSKLPDKPLLPLILCPTQYQWKFLLLNPKLAKAELQMREKKKHRHWMLLEQAMKMQLALRPNP